MQNLNDFYFWRSLSPILHINDPSYIESQIPISFSRETLESTRSLMVTEGYFQLPPMNHGVQVSELANTVSKLKQNNLHPVYAFVYDEYWLLFYKLHALISNILGNEYVRLPDFWAWHVDPKKNESGWRPHRDRGRYTLNEDKTPKTITVWIPLTDATPLNSCMYIVPADRDPTYNTEEENSHRFEFSNVRALPAQAGTILCWNQAVLHWGSNSCNRATTPRMSLAFEFQRGDMNPYNEPVSEPNKFPTFEERLGLISKQIQQYQHMYTV